MREFRGLERESKDERLATAILREERERDKQRADELVERLSDKRDEE